MANFSYEVFSKVVERGTLAKAAAELNVTPSAVSHSVSQLETELGFPLLIRNRTGVALTEDGAQVLQLSVASKSAIRTLKLAWCKALLTGSLRRSDWELPTLAFPPYQLALASW